MVFVLRTSAAAGAAAAPPLAVLQGLHMPFSHTVFQWISRCNWIKHISINDGSNEPFHGIFVSTSGSAYNQAGRSSGLTAPNGPAQTTLIKTALQVWHVGNTRHQCADLCSSQS